MKLSTKSRYALRALANLIDQGCCCSVKKIAKNEHLSSDYLEKIFSKLKKAGVLEVERGASGGYMLSRDPKDITLKEVISALEKPEFSCPDICTCHSKNLYQQIQSGFNQVLSSINLGSVDNSQKTVYLDYAASTPVDPRVLSTIITYFDPKYSGNSSSLHQFGLNAAQVIEDSRTTFAKILNGNEKDIIFTSSATESNNTVLKGVAWANQKKGKHIIISSIEHDCVRNSAQWLKTQGFEITQVPVDKDGLIDFKFLEKNIRPDTILVSIIHGNNEIGTIQDIHKIGKLCHDHGVYFHTDASQSFSKVPLDVQKDNINFLTISSQKIYGPKGVALLYVKSGSKITPLLHGGGHEFGLRSSTVNIPLIAGFTKAAELAIDSMASENKRLSNLRDFLIKNILKNIPDTHLNGSAKNRLCNNINISFDKIEGESILLDLDMNGIICSTGSACSSHSLEPSHVLLALGLKPEQAHSSIRFSLGRFTTKKDLDYLLTILPQTIQKMRQLSPFK